MTTWNLGLTATLDHAPGEDTAYAVARGAAGHDFDLLLVSVHELRLAVRVTTEHDGIPALDELQARLVDALAAAGFTVTRWEAGEALTVEETERRLAAASTPRLVSAAEFADLCGVSPKRIYELETERRTAAEAGKPHPFPTPMARGVWLRAAAEQYARTRNTKAGRPPKTETS
ncbi:hypothetical protein NQK81_13240 [Amycolatopsis roodepoortensis]|uniref:hypothetical protein n=1 Tax=Amycolatopsis roodepoortensis TaxID=700274 RepID=UPI00214C345C|nr:hypothetical protein [Amycolatopsis roodepoortensis]UUV34369.1 hypothetical protein NQK81_13240 [Amycolatopsis roodepoortensis]